MKKFPGIPVLFLSAFLAAALIPAANKDSLAAPDDTEIQTPDDYGSQDTSDFNLHSLKDPSSEKQGSTIPEIQDPAVPDDSDDTVSLEAPAADFGSFDDAAAYSEGDITYETSGDYVHTIYANGQPLLIVASEDIQYAKLYIDSNRNGIGEDEEELRSFIGDGKVNGIFYREGYGYFLTNSTIYGGSKDGSCQYNTSITLTGVTDPSYSSTSPYTAKLIYGGNAAGTFTGSSQVVLSGGNAGWVFAGSREGSIYGDTSVHMKGGCVLKNMYGGSAFGQINGNTSIHVEVGQVNSVYGGNENSGAISGNTNLTFEAGTEALGWIYGGGAGYSDSAITEVNGSTNITINGGTFHHNIYGGGGFRGAKVGSANIVFNNGNITNSWIYGGGEEESSVTGETSVTVNGGAVYSVCAAGAGFNNTTAEVGSARIRLLGGTVQQFSALPNDISAIHGDLSLELSGNTFSGTELYLGQAKNPNKLQNITVTLKDGKAALLRLQSPAEQSLSITLENADLSDLVLLSGTIGAGTNAALSFRNCGSAEGRWGTLIHTGSSSDYFTDIDNPLLIGSHLNGNQFTSIMMENSYINYYDDSTTDQDNSLKNSAKKLVIDGGALRVTGNMLTCMPETEFRNNPLLIRTSSYYEGLHFDANPSGTAKIQWMNSDGTGIPQEEMHDHGIAETPSDAPDTAFVSASSDYAMKTENGSRSDSDNNILWQGKVWYTGSADRLCKCQVALSSLEETMFPLPEGSDETTVVLRDVASGSTSFSDNCPVIEHKGTVIRFTYTIIPEGTTIPDATLNENNLTVGSAGAVRIKVSQNLNGKTADYETDVRIIRTPESDSFTYTKGLADELPLSFYGNGIPFEQQASYIWDDGKHQYVDIDNYTITPENDSLQFLLKQEYLNSLEFGEYRFHTSAHISKDGGGWSSYDYHFTVKIVPPVEVTNPVIELTPGSFHYDGAEKEPSVIVKNGSTIIPSDEYTVSYQNNLNVGTASVTITDNPGGHYIVSGKTEFDIINDYQPVNGVDYTTSLNEYGWTNSDFVITAKKGYLLSTGNTLKDQWVETLYGAEGDGTASGGTLSFYVRNMTTKEISLIVREEYKIDRTAPEQYDITFNENSVKKLLHEITFGLFFSNSVKVQITAKDRLSGIGQISYFLSETVLTEDQVQSLTDWTEGDSFSIPPADEEKFIVYAKVSDRAGNTICFASDGAEFDLTPPVITGVTDGSVYYTTQIASAADRHLDTVSLNGASASEKIRLPGNTDVSYVIEASDKAGSKTVVIIRMKTIQSLADSISGLTEEQVTSDDKETLTGIQTIDTTNATPEEKAELQPIQDTARHLLSIIEDAQNTLIKAGQTTGGISKDTVKLTDKETLEAAKTSLETALKEHGGNYTSDEKQTIEAELLRITLALESIEHAQTAIDSITKLPDAEDVSPDDTNTENAAKEALALFESLTEHEKSLVDTTKLELVLAALTDYKLLEGDGSQWNKGEDGCITFKANGPVYKFTGVLVDEKAVDKSSYTVTAGSTIITFTESYLSSLSVGKHKLTVLYLDGDTSGMFEISKSASGSGNTGGDPGQNNPENPSDNDNPVKPSDGNHSEPPSDMDKIRTTAEDNNTATPQTGDTCHLPLWLLLLFLSGSGILIIRKKYALPDA